MSSVNRMRKYSSNDSGDDLSLQSERTERPRIDWVLLKSFKSLDDAKQFLTLKGFSQAFCNKGDESTGRKAI
jgi:hypothetical protein